MTTIAQVIQQPVRSIPTESDALSCMTFCVHGPRDRSRVGVALRAALRLDTDPQTDPLYYPTVQVSAHNTGQRSIQTDPYWGLPPGGVYA